MAKSQIYSFRHPLARRVQTHIEPGSITQNEFARESDINYLVDKHIKSGVQFPTTSADAFQDVSNLPDFQAAMNATIKAEQAWYSLDARIRRHFNDKPEQFLQAIHDPAQREELVRLNIFKAPEGAQPKAEPKGEQGDPSTAKRDGGAVAPGTVST